MAAEKTVITSKTTLFSLGKGNKASVRKVCAGAKERKYLQDRGIDVGMDLTVKNSGQEGVEVEYGCGRTEIIPAELAACIFMAQPLERHLDPMISGGCCSYGNTAGALDMMNEINEKTFVVQ